MLAKAAGRGADALILDMEDAVAPSAKLEARATIRRQLDELAPSGLEIWIRVNNDPGLLTEDLDVATHPVVHGVFLPKVNSAEDVERALEVVARTDLAIDPMIETGRAVLDAEHIASAPNVTHVTLGLADLGADLHVSASPDDPAWASIRMQMVVVSSAVGIEPPLAPVSPNFNALDSFGAGCRAWANAGYGGRQVIHPAQVAIVNDVFSPSATEIDEAHRVVKRFDAALADGQGAIRDDDGTMLDEAFVRRARRILDIAGLG